MTIPKSIPTLLQRLWRSLTGQRPPAATPAPASSEGHAPAAAASPTLSAQSSVRYTLSSAQGSPDYRRDCAQHLYARYGDRIYRGTLPAMLHAVAVLELQLDWHGHITGTHWLRTPSHAPEVCEQIEALVYAAAPFPAAAHLAQPVYMETWLWDASGQFQLHTLTEGQQ